MSNIGFRDIIENYHLAERIALTNCNDLAEREIYLDTLASAAFILNFPKFAGYI